MNKPIKSKIIATRKRATNLGLLRLHLKWACSRNGVILQSLIVR